MEWCSEVKSLFNIKFYQTLNKTVNRFDLSIACCRLCQQQATRFNSLCETCFNDLPLFHYQHLSGNLLNWPAIAKALPKHQFDYLFCSAPYIWPFNHWLTLFKYHNHYELSHLLAQITVYQWQVHSMPDNFSEKSAITSVPLHFKKWRQRGYNQAHLLAKAVARQLSLPYLPTLIERIKETEQQVGQTGAQRRRNLKGAFSLNEKFTELPQHIILIDDVVTTGSTANEICKLLKRQGIETVTLLTVCLTLP